MLKFIGLEFKRKEDGGWCLQFNALWLVVLNLVIFAFISFASGDKQCLF